MDFLTVLKGTKTFKTLAELALKNRIVLLQGGTSSGKTYSSLILIYTILSSFPGLLASIVSETFPHLKRGAMRDFFDIISPVYVESRHNKTDSIYSVCNSKVEFFSTDAPGKVRGPRRNILYMNEGNNNTKEIFDQLEIRTKDLILIDFNPVEHFWAHELIGRPGVGFFVSTYKDNDFLSKGIINSIESRRELDPNWWNVYGLGMIGKIEGLIFPYFNQIDEFPNLPQTIGIDFGYTNDPSVVVRVAETSTEIFVDEIIYQRGLNTAQLGKLMEVEGVSKKGGKIVDVCFADSADPRAIDDLCAQGFIIKPAAKGRDSVIAGLDSLSKKKISITKRSVNIIKEFRNYRWQKDKNGNYINVPIAIWNHGIDSIRYARNENIETPAVVSAGRVKF